MSDKITPEVSDRICQHMNEDHAEAVALYAKIYGNSPETETAQMVSIDPEGMNLTAQVKADNIPIRITFEHTLVDSEDAHHTLISMLKQARQK